MKKKRNKEKQQQICEICTYLYIWKLSIMWSCVSSASFFSYSRFSIHLRCEESSLIIWVNTCADLITSLMEMKIKENEPVEWKRASTRITCEKFLLEIVQFFYVTLTNWLFRSYDFYWSFFCGLVRAFPKKRNRIEYKKTAILFYVVIPFRSVSDLCY